MKFEKPQPGNPNGLAIRQHVIPARSIQRFAGADGCVQVHSDRSPDLLRLKPNSDFFTVARIWDQRAEVLWMKQIEDRFQALVDDLLTGRVEFIDDEQAWAVNLFFSLWYWRSRQEKPTNPEVQLNGMTGNSFSLEEEERLEKAHVIFTREGGRVPSRFITSVQLQSRVIQYARQIEDWTWGVIQAQAGEFLMPDVPSHGLLPITPKIVLAANHPNGTVLQSNLREINIAFLAYTWRYFLARDIATAMEGISEKDIIEAARVRDARIASGEALQGPTSV